MPELPMLRQKLRRSRRSSDRRSPSRGSSSPGEAASPLHRSPASSARSPASSAGGRRSAPLVPRQHARPAVLSEDLLLSELRAAGKDVVPAKSSSSARLQPSARAGPDGEPLPPMAAISRPTRPVLCCTAAPPPSLHLKTQERQQATERPKRQERYQPTERVEESTARALPHVRAVSTPPQAASRGRSGSGTPSLRRAAPEGAGHLSSAASAQPLLPPAMLPLRPAGSSRDVPRRGSNRGGCLATAAASAAAETAKPSRGAGAGGGGGLTWGVAPASTSSTEASGSPQRSRPQARDSSRQGRLSGQRPASSPSPARSPSPGGESLRSRCSSWSSGDSSVGPWRVKFDDFASQLPHLPRASTPEELSRPPPPPPLEPFPPAPSEPVAFAPATPKPHKDGHSSFSSASGNMLDASSSMVRLMKPHEEAVESPMSTMASPSRHGGHSLGSRLSTGLRRMASAGRSRPAAPTS